MAAANSEMQASTDDRRDATTLFIKFRRKISPIFTMKFLKIFMFGQMLSLLICGTSVTSQLLFDRHGVAAPTAQSFTNYLLLGLVYGIQLFFISGRDGFKKVLKTRWWKYLFVAAVDVEANYLVVKAYQYTNLTSIQLLDCITIPVVLLLSFIVLRVRYRWLHYVGVGICLIGVGALVGSDIYAGRSHIGGSDKFLGDMLCLVGASLYGVSNVAEEYAIRNFSRVEFLGMLGMWGSLISGIQLVALERNELTSLSWGTEVILLLLGFALCLFLLYSIFPVVIKLSSATVVNLSILTADFYTFFCGLLIFHYMFSPLYILAFSTIIGGLIIYSLKPTAEAPRDSTYAPMDTETGDRAVSIQRRQAKEQPMTVDVPSAVDNEGPNETQALNTSINN
ncbi:solute carrier family 35 member F2-like [Ptychodera flava]|uniref:solute carrier family 35 member F2-like n=1 Tax=Ptychodera flava TaxID=63121 RepID=UPI003969F10F